jgi:outer membrane protein OmpU
MKKTLLASTALVGAALLAAPANAGTVGSRDTMSVTLNGTLWFSVSMYDEDVSAGNGRGYRFGVNESEIHVKAQNTADNGITYGVMVELNAGAADGTAADEAYAFLDSDSWGRLELGDEDDATNRMRFGSQNAHKGLGGPAGGLGGNLTLFHAGAGFATWGGESMQARADWDNNTTGDDTKATYFTPRFSGFQLGASLTPDTGINSGTGGLTDADNDGDYENVISLGANYRGQFDEVGVGLSVTGQFGDDEDAAGAETEDLSILGVGGRVDFAGFTLGAHWTDFGDTGITVANALANADAGSTWSVGVGYQAGPWGFSAWYTDHEKGNASTSPAGALTSELQRFGVGAGYTVAPGWLLRADLEYFSHDNASDGAGTGTVTDNDGRGFMLTNMFIF